MEAGSWPRIERYYLWSRFFINFSDYNARFLIYFFFFFLKKKASVFRWLLLMSELKIWDCWADCHCSYSFLNIHIPCQIVKNLKKTNFLSWGKFISLSLANLLPSSPLSLPTICEKEAHFPFEADKHLPLQTSEH